LAERPTSAKPGDEAIILGDGTLEGFVGGTCAEATVRDQSLALLASGEALVLRITPVEEADQPGKRVVHNPCLSGGTLEVFLEPSVPPPLVLVVGDAPIAKALQSIGAALGYCVQVYAGDIAPDTAAMVVASHGRDEEEALAAAIEAGVPYIGLVASARRGRAVLDHLRVTEPCKAQIHTPAGLDIGATTSEEVALSILAEMVAARPRQEPARSLQTATITAHPVLDPVCGMTVFPGDGALQLDHDGRTVWFCGRGCRDAFAANPAAYRS
jgi:xanthine dehydrogenase accessory factor